MRNRIELLVPALSALCFVAPLAVSTLSACGDASDSTAGKRVELAARVQAESLSFTNAYAWNVEIERALLSIGPLSYLEGAVVARRGSTVESLGRWFTVRAAHAHPGHYEEGGTVGEMLVPASVDLALGAADLGAGPGITGNALSARFSFQSPPQGEFAADLGTSVVIVEGMATQGTESRLFRAAASVDDVLEGGIPAVVGCEFKNGGIGADGMVTLELRLSVWLDQIDFALVPASTDGTPVELARDQTPHKAFVRGLKKAAAYAFSYAPRS